MPIHTIISEKRKALGLTQEQVGAYLGVSAPAVNKWEKGSTCPDISLLAPLARLLKTDPNTLLCFEEDLSQQEILRISQEIYELSRTSGIAAAFSFARENMRRYPNCIPLAHQLALTLEGFLVFSDLLPEEKEDYLKELLPLYERCAESEDTEIRSSALFMLASKYIQKNDTEKAGEILERIPPRPMDKRHLQVNLYMQEGKTAEAAELTQRLLLASINETQILFTKLVETEIADGALEQASQAADLAARASRALGLWGYYEILPHLQLAIELREIEKCLHLFEALLKSAFHPWKQWASPLFYRIPGKPFSEDEWNRTWKKFLPALLTDMEQNPEYDFLRKEAAFQNLIDAYRRKCEAIPEE